MGILLFYTPLCSFASAVYSFSLSRMAAVCAGLTGRSTLPGTPTTKLPAGDRIFRHQRPGGDQTARPDDRTV